MDLSTPAHSGLYKTQRKTTEDMVMHSETRLSYVANIIVLSWCDVNIDVTLAYNSIDDIG